MPETKSLPLATEHQTSGARFMPLAGWQVPAHFGDPEAEYRAARSSVALFDASFLTLVTAEGRDHIEYLNRRLSQWTLGFQPGDGVRATQLNADGRMEADLELFRLDENLTWMIAPPAVAGEYLAFLADKYVFTEDARFTDRSGEYAFFALIGPRRGEVLTALGLPTLADGKRIIVGDGFNLLTSEYLTDAVIVAILSSEAAGFHDRIREAVVAVGGRSLGFLAFDTLRVEAGIAWWGIDLTAKSIPLEADLHSAVHTNKGCYPGQETIAKILNLGHPARKLVGVVLKRDDPPAADTPLFVDGQEIGRLTSSTWSPALGTSIGLGMVRWPYRNPGTEVALSSGERGKVVPLPFSLLT